MGYEKNALMIGQHKKRFNSKLIIQMLIFVTHLCKAYLNREHVFRAKSHMTHLLRVRWSHGTMVPGQIVQKIYVQFTYVCGTGTNLPEAH